MFGKANPARFTGVYIFLSLFSKFNIPQCGQKGISTLGFYQNFRKVCPPPLTVPVMRRWLPGNRKAPSTKWKMVNLHLGNNRRKKIPCLSWFPSNTKPSCQARGWAASPPPDWQGFIHKLCTKSHPNPYDWSGINDISLHSLLCPC